MALLATTALVPSLSPQGGAEPTVPQLAVLYTSLYVVALGTGGIKPNVSAFGADQFDDKSHADRREKQSFFNYFYLSINVGSLIACTVIVWIQVSSPPTVKHTRKASHRALRGPGIRPIEWHAPTPSPFFLDSVLCMRLRCMVADGIRICVDGNRHRPLGGHLR